MTDRIKLPEEMLRDVVTHPGSHGEAVKALALEQLAAEVESLRAKVERVRGFCDDLQVPAVHGTYQGGYQAARDDMRRALDGET